MGTTPSSDLYPTVTWKNPLLYPLYVKTNDHTSISIQVRDDWLLSAYVEKLNQEIVDDIKEFREHKDVITKIFWSTRTFGWSGVQFYKNEVKVFSSLEWTKWITEMNDTTKKLERVGMEVKWIDDLGNNWNDSVYFDDRVNENNEIVGKCYLFIWEKGNGRVLPNQPSLSAFALADVGLAILGISIQCRQILDTLTFGATTPYFYLLQYGESITPKQRTDLVNQMSYVGVSKAIGAKATTLEDIKAIENGAVDKASTALNELIGYFSAVTRLPLLYYKGEKMTGGLGDTGATIDEIKIARKKEYVLQHFLPGLSEIFTEQWDETLPDLYDYYDNELEEQKKIKVIKDEERTKNSDQETQIE